MNETAEVYNQSSDFYLEQIGSTISELAETPEDQSHLTAFASLVLETGGGRVLDLGCGVGRATSFLHDAGLDISGVDISTGMLEGARLSHPHLEFSEGSFFDIDAADRELAGACLWYSTIHTSLPDLDACWTELARTVRHGGHVLLAFQSGNNERVEVPNAHQTSATLVSYRHNADDVVEALKHNGFDIVTRATRDLPPPHQRQTTALTFITAVLRR